MPGVSVGQIARQRRPRGSRDPDRVPLAGTAIFNLDGITDLQRAGNSYQHTETGQGLAPEWPLLRC